jgi:hypothetical protein
LCNDIANVTEAGNPFLEGHEVPIAFNSSENVCVTYGEGQLGSWILRNEPALDLAQSQYPK